MELSSHTAHRLTNHYLVEFLDCKPVYIQNLMKIRLIIFIYLFLLLLMVFGLKTTDAL